MSANFEFKIRITKQFDAFCKKVMKNELKNYYRQKKHRYENEVSFSEIFTGNSKALSKYDTYSVDKNCFSTLDFTVEIEHDLLFEALCKLKECNRDIIILKYWLDMSDREIAKKLNLSKSKVNYTRLKAMQEIKKFMEDN